MIRPSFPQPQIFLSSHIPDLQIFSDLVSIVAVISSGTEEIFRSRYYPANGVTTIYDLRSIIEQFLARTPGRCFGSFMIEISPEGDNTHPDVATIEFDVILCSMNILTDDDWQWLDENFLRFTAHQRIAPDGLIRLSWFNPTVENQKIQITCNYISTDTGVASIHTFQEDCFPDENNPFAIFTLSMRVANIEAMVAMDIDRPIRLLAVTIQAGRRSATFYIDNALKGATSFFFTNCFGIIDQLTLQAVVTRKLETDRAAAESIDRILPYNDRPRRSFELQSGALSSPETILAEQLLASTDVRLPVASAAGEQDFNAMWPIVITDFTADFANDDEKLNTLKLSWQFQSMRPTIIPDQSGGVFDSNYNPAFL
ncbi:MAG: hypothetical protein HDR49_00270 [Bacteroides sp.]|nr:hypothetical protein [Bacteroides sp.]